MNDLNTKRIGVYCGSVTGLDAAYVDAAEQLGAAIGKAGLGLVYGGGSSGLMGVVAQAALKNGGHVTGVMPVQLVDAEKAFYAASEYHEVHDFHERKALMAELSSAFMALPGGPGTLEELAEQLAWKAAGYHQKMIFIINVRGYWNHLLAMLCQMNQNMGNPNNYIVVDEPKDAVAMFLKLNQMA